MPQRLASAAVLRVVVNLKIAQGRFAQLDYVALHNYILASRISASQIAGPLWTLPGQYTLASSALAGRSAL